MWIVMGVGLMGLVIFLFILWKPLFTPWGTQPSQTVAVIEKRPFISNIEIISSEPPKEIQKTESAPILKESPSIVQVEKGLPEPKPLIEEKKEKPLPNKMIEEKRDQQAKQTQKEAIEKKESSLPSSSPKEESSSPSIGIEQEGGRDRILVSEGLSHFNSGVHFYQQGEISKAIQTYQKAIELNPSYVEAYNNLGIIYQEIGDLEGALKAFQKAIEINPGYEKGYNNLGILFLFKGHYDKTAEAFQKALEINPNNIESHINLGTLYKGLNPTKKPLPLILSMEKLITI